MSANTAIEVRGLAKRYGSVTALDGVDLRVEPGEILGYVGPNGSGKTTTVRVLLGLVSDWQGQAVVAGLDPRKAPVEVRRRVGYVPESAPLYDVLTTAEFLLLVGRAHGLDDAHTRERTEACLEALEIPDRVGHRLGTLSKGMRQKVLITAALLHRPRILMLDEPLSGLDVSASITVKDFLQGFADAGGAVLYCSHVMDVVERVCDRICVLRKGRIIAEGTFEELRGSDDATLESLFSRLTSERDPAARAAGMLEALLR